MVVRRRRQIWEAFPMWAMLHCYSTHDKDKSRRSSPSLKGMIRDDPFMVAFVKCTKNQNSKTAHNNSGDNQRKKSSYSVGLSSKKGRRLFFFCKNAFADVEVDNLMKYSNLPPLPGHKDSIRLHR
nr:hypothetical protein CICLE_v10026641mg [Ipomoea batatas]